MDVLDGLWLELRRVKRRLLLVIAAWVYLIGLSL